MAGLAVKAFGGENVTLIVNKDAQSTYWPEDMPTDIVEQRMYAPEAELVKATLVDPRDAAAAVAAAHHLIFCAEWGAAQSELAEVLLPHAGDNLKRCVMLSRVGLNRRDKLPFVVRAGGRGGKLGARGREPVAGRPGGRRSERVVGGWWEGSLSLNSSSSQHLSTFSFLLSFPRTTSPPVFNE